MPIGTTSYPPIETSLVAASFVIVAGALLLSSIRDGMFRKEFDAIRGTFELWRKRHENPLIVHGLSKTAMRRRLGVIGVVGLYFAAVYVAFRSESEQPNPEAWLWLAWFSSSGFKWFFPFCLLLAYMCDPWRSRPLDDLALSRLSPAEIRFERMYPACLIATIAWAPIAICSLASEWSRHFSQSEISEYAVRGFLMAGTTSVGGSVITAILALTIAISLRLRNVTFLLALGLSAFAGFGREFVLGRVLPSIGLGTKIQYMLDALGPNSGRANVVLDLLTGLPYGIALALAMIGVVRWAAVPRSEGARFCRLDRLRVLSRQVMRGRLLAPAITLVALGLFSEWVIVRSAGALGEWLNAGGKVPGFLETPWSAVRMCSFALVSMAWWFRKRNPKPHRNAILREILCNLLILGVVIVAFVAAARFFGSPMSRRGSAFYDLLIFIYTIPIISMLHMMGSKRPGRALLGWMLILFWYEFSKQSMMGNSMYLTRWGSLMYWSAWYVYPFVIGIALIMWGRMLEKLRHAQAVSLT